MNEKETTIGQLLLRQIFPPGFYNGEVLDKSTMSRLLSRLAKEYPEQYREISYKLNQLGLTAATRTGGMSFSIADLLPPPGARLRRQKLQKQIDGLLDDDGIDDDSRRKSLIQLLSDIRKEDVDDILRESKDEHNPLAAQLIGAGRGNAGSLASLRGSDLLYEDSQGNILPVPVLRGFSQGLSPTEYFAASFGARRGVLATKLSTADAGYYGKQLSQLGHRLVVTGEDSAEPAVTLRGLPVSVYDDDNEGALLARDTGGYARNTVLTPKILKDLRAQGLDRILVRSPIAFGSPEGGIYARDAGIREFGRLPNRGENLGLVAAQSFGEPLSQGSLGAKHGGGVAGASKISGFQLVNQLVNIPKTFRGGAAHAELDGAVNKIEEAPAGGTFVYVNGQQHYVPRDHGLKVRIGSVVEAGDVLSEGVPNPSQVVRHKGIGEGRRYFTDVFLRAFRDSGLRANRRNVELLARGLINHVKLSQETEDGSPDDVVPYSQLESRWQPRAGTRTVKPGLSRNQYLERPYLHYSIGTRVRPSVIRDLEEFGVQEVDVHPDPPPFEPLMIRAADNLQYDPDPLVQMYGSGLKGNLLESAHRGATSTTQGTSFVPSLAKGIGFGREGLTISPKR